MRIGNIEITADPGLKIDASTQLLSDPPVTKVHVSKMVEPSHTEWAVSGVKDGASRVIYFGPHEQLAQRAFDESLGQYDLLHKKKVTVEDALAPALQRD